MYTETTLEFVDGEKGVKHTNSFVAGEIRTDCEV
jgi:hypothetical protein